jgi:hypothetical protein
MHVMIDITNAFLIEEKFFSAVKKLILNHKRRGLAIQNPNA